MKPEEAARQLIDRQLNQAGWDVVGRNEYVPMHSLAVRESLMEGNKESDYLFFIDDKAIAVLEAKRTENNLGTNVAEQAEYYASHPLSWYKLWNDGLIPLVYLSNGKRLLFRNLLEPDSDFRELKEMHSPKDMLRHIKRESKFGKLPLIQKTGLRDCQYEALVELEERLRRGDKKFLSILATGSGKTYLACLATYRQLAYTDTKRVLFLVDRNNLGRQAATEFSRFSMTENGIEMGKIYDICRLRKEDDIKGEIVISTIQKLYSVMTGQELSDDNEDEEDELLFMSSDISGEAITIDTDNLKLPRDYFQFIVVDECHRSIYGKWGNVLRYFDKAAILGLTATPTPEAYAFFDKNVIENYSYEDSVIDGVNVPYDVYITKTNITEHGGTILHGDLFTEKTRLDGSSVIRESEIRYDYKPSELDRGITVKNQIDTVIAQFRDSIYSDLYPERAAEWSYIPKTLIFAKNDNHATEIMESCSRIFGEKFSDGKVPEGFVQKITYTTGDSDMLIQQFRSSKTFRIAVTVTLVSTGTDIKPLEIVMFMSDVKSEVLYQQMKGRGCRTISDSLLHEVTPNADTKSKFIVFDAVGVTESDKLMPKSSTLKPGQKKLTLDFLLEHLAHGDLKDENLFLLKDYCSSINQRYDNNQLLKHHIDEYLADFNFLPRTIAQTIETAFANKTVPPFISNGVNNERLNLIRPLIFNLNARKKLLELKAGYDILSEGEDEVIYSGFDKSEIRSRVDKFEEYINDHQDDIEALRIIYNSGLTITMPMLLDLKAKLLDEDSSFTVPRLWSWYRMIDEKNAVGDPGIEIGCLTNIIQLVRYGYRLSPQLVSLSRYANSRFNLYAGQIQNELSDEQVKLMKIISEYVAVDGEISVSGFMDVDIDIWRRLIQLFGNANTADREIRRMSGFILRAV